jgi:hypothetical protein
MAETTKLSVGQALDKLRGTETPKTKMTRADEKIARKGLIIDRELDLLP